MKRKLWGLAVLAVAWSGYLQAQGCYFTGGSLPARQLTTTSGNRQFDQINIREYKLLCEVFGVYPDFYYLYDKGAPNAYATPLNRRSALSDGTVMLGFDLIEAECGKSPTGTCSAVPIILAHEFGHILDFKYRTGLTGKYKELFADYIAGAYLFHRAHRLGRLSTVEVAYSFFAKGDYGFNHPMHHGTPLERYNCLNGGHTLAGQYAARGRYLSVPDLMAAARRFVRRF